MMMLQGGVKLAEVVKALNALGASPQDLLATIYRHLGIDPEQEFLDFAGRPQRILAHGQPIRELL